MTFPRVAFTATPDLSAEVLYPFQLNVDERYVGNAEFDLGAPTWSGVPGGTGGRDGYRTVRFNHFISARTDPATEALSALGRLLMADDGWLLIQLTETSPPVWARTWRSSPGSLSIENVFLRDGTPTGQHMIPVALTADPLLYDENKVLVSAATVNNDPAAETNACHLVLPEVVGDAPAPLVVSVTPSVALSQFSDYRMLASVHPGAPVVWQIGTDDGWTATGDVGSPVTDADYSGGSYRSATFATTQTLDKRLGGTAPAALAPGSYRVLLRAARSDDDSEFSLRFRFADPVTTTTFGGDTVYVQGAAAGSGYAAWIDLGVHAWPFGVHPADAANLDSVAPSMSLELGRTSGTGALQLDCLMLVPVETVDSDQTTTLIDQYDMTAASTLVWDGETERTWGSASGDVPTFLNHQLQGSYLAAAPGESASLTLLPGLLVASGINDDITATIEVTVTYRPRWLWLQP